MKNIIGHPISVPEKYFWKYIIKKILSLFTYKEYSYKALKHFLFNRFLRSNRAIWPYFKRSPWDEL